MTREEINDRFVAEALRLTLRSMRKDPERHVEAIAAAERELAELRGVGVQPKKRPRRIRWERLARPAAITLCALGLFVLPSDMVTHAVFSDRLASVVGLASIALGAPFALRRHG